MNPIPRIAGLALLAVLAAGCSTPPAQQGRVAAPEATGPSPKAVSASSTTLTASRPRQRLDLTADEIHALTETYHKCLADNGYDTVKAKEAAAAGKKVPDESNRPAAEAACLSKKPLPPWEYDLANPESPDFVRAVVQCLRDKGVRYVDEVPPSPDPNEDRRSQIALGGPNNDAQSVSKGLDLLPICEKEQTPR
ncbi:hypothetical protein AB0I81_18685 [Nonomuraea sp. NPDC050404]|uniref:hypothetical protein n=1 Tax=Nonomuraea sp. NPDC050404 TaxID=3155783 RepID=UPI0033D7DC06